MAMKVQITLPPNLLQAFLKWEPGVAHVEKIRTLIRRAYSSPAIQKELDQISDPGAGEGVFSVKLSDWDGALLDTLANRLGLSRAGTIRVLLIHALGDVEKETTEEESKEETDVSSVIQELIRLLLHRG